MKQNPLDFWLADPYLFLQSVGSPHWHDSSSLDSSVVSGSSHQWRVYRICSFLSFPTFHRTDSQFSHRGFTACIFPVAEVLAWGSRGMNRDQQVSAAQWDLCCSRNVSLGTSGVGDRSDLRWLGADLGISRPGTFQCSCKTFVNSDLSTISVGNITFLLIFSITVAYVYYPDFPVVLVVKNTCCLCSEMWEQRFKFYKLGKSPERAWQSAEFLAWNPWSEKLKALQSWKLQANMKLFFFLFLSIISLSWYIIKLDACERRNIWTGEIYTDRLIFTLLMNCQIYFEKNCSSSKKYSKTFCQIPRLQLYDDKNLFCNRLSDGRRATI